MSGIHQPPQPVPCGGCGAPQYDLEPHECDASAYFDTREETGQFKKGSNVKVVAPPSTINQLRSAADNLTLSAFAYRNTGDPIMKESMLRAHELIADLVITLISEKEG